MHVDSDIYAKLEYLHNRPQPFLLYTKTVIYRCSRVVELDQPRGPTSRVVVECENGEQSIVLSGVEEVVVKGQGFTA